MAMDAITRNFTQVPNEWIRDNDLSSTEKIILIIISSYKDQRISYSEMAKCSALCAKTCRSAVKNLISKGYLTRINSGPKSCSQFKCHINPIDNTKTFNLGHPAKTKQSSNYEIPDYTPPKLDSYGNECASNDDIKAAFQGLF